VPYHAPRSASRYTQHTDPHPQNTHIDGNIFAEELDPVVLHVLAGAVGHILVEASQQDGAHHDGDVQAQAHQEAGALQGHVGGPDHQGLPRAVGQREQVVAGEGGSHTTRGGTGSQAAVK